MGLRPDVQAQSENPARGQMPQQITFGDSCAGDLPLLDTAFDGVFLLFDFSSSSFSFLRIDDDLDAFHDSPQLDDGCTVPVEDHGAQLAVSNQQADAQPPPHVSRDLCDLLPLNNRRDDRVLPPLILQPRSLQKTLDSSALPQWHA